jgi:ammonia channel protein AmtB
MCTSLLIAAVLFFVLSPGVVLTLPPGSRGVFCSGQTSLAAAAVHAVVFFAVGYVLMYGVPGVEGFDNTCASLSDMDKKTYIREWAKMNP